MAQTTKGMSSKNAKVEFTTVQTLTNGVTAAAQAVIIVDDTTGMAAGDTLEYKLVGGAIEQNTINSNDSGTQVTMDSNVGTGGIADNEQVNKIVDISGAANSISVSGGTRMSGEAYTPSGDGTFITVGKREPIEVTFSGIYSETTTTSGGIPEFFEEGAAVYESGAGAGLRWSPAGYDATNEKRYWTTDTLGSYIQVVPIISWSYPSLDFSSGDPIVVEFTLKAPQIGTTDSA